MCVYISLARVCVGLKGAEKKVNELVDCDVVVLG